MFPEPSSGVRAALQTYQQGQGVHAHLIRCMLWFSEMVSEDGWERCSPVALIHKDRYLEHTGNALQDGVGKGFLKRTPLTGEPRPTTVSWDLTELKVEHSTRTEGTTEWDRVCQLWSGKGLAPEYIKNSKDRVKKTNDQIYKWTMDPNREFAKEEMKVGKKQLKKGSLSLNLGVQHQNNCGIPSCLVRMGKTTEQRTANAGEGAGRGNPHSLLVDGQLVQLLWKSVWEVFWKLKMNLPYDPATQRPGICPEDWTC